MSTVGEFLLMSITMRILGHQETSLLSRHVWCHAGCISPINVSYTMGALFKRSLRGAHIIQFQKKSMRLSPDFKKICMPATYTTLTEYYFKDPLTNLLRTSLYTYMADRLKLVAVSATYHTILYTNYGTVFETTRFAPNCESRSWNNATGAIYWTPQLQRHDWHQIVNPAIETTRLKQLKSLLKWHDWRQIMNFVVEMTRLAPNHESRDWNNTIDTKLWIPQFKQHDWY